RTPATTILTWWQDPATARLLRRSPHHCRAPALFPAETDELWDRRRRTPLRHTTALLSCRTLPLARGATRRKNGGHGDAFTRRGDVDTATLLAPGLRLPVAGGVGCGCTPLRVGWGIARHRRVVPSGPSACTIAGSPGCRRCSSPSALCLAQGSFGDRADTVV